MLLFPNAKINLGLQVIAKRADGYHDIATVFYPLAITDVLEAVRAPDFSFQVSGLIVDAAPENNLCVRAWRLLQERFELPGVAMALHKSIALGAGLGGGSSNGAFTLQLINKLFKLELSTDELLPFALQLGSDCPFFLLNQPAFATGRGERLKPLEIPPMQGKKILLVNPSIHISTAKAFAAVTPRPPMIDLTQLVQEPVASWKGRLPNDFEEPVFRDYPILAGIQQKLYAHGAVFAGMTGTGSTIYGIFDELPEDPAAWFPSEYRVLCTQ